MASFHLWRNGGDKGQLVRTVYRTRYPTSACARVFCMNPENEALRWNYLRFKWMVVPFDAKTKEILVFPYIWTIKFVEWCQHIPVSRILKKGKGGQLFTSDDMWKYNWFPEGRDASGTLAAPLKLGTLGALYVYGRECTSFPVRQIFLHVMID